MRNEKNRSNSPRTSNTQSDERAHTTASAAPNATNQTPESVEVLYQKLGDRWFAFSLIGEDVYFGSVNQDEVNAAENAKPAPRKGRGVDRTGNA